MDDPFEFCNDMMNIVTHGFLILGTVKSQSDLMKPHDPSVSQNDFTLRDITFILRTVRSLMQGLYVISMPTTNPIACPKEIGEMLLSNITSSYSNGLFNRNYSKLIGQIIFCISMMLPFDQ